VERGNRRHRKELGNNYLNRRHSNCQLCIV
jgi:hypothetical protein